MKLPDNDPAWMNVPLLAASTSLMASTNEDAAQEREKMYEAGHLADFLIESVNDKEVEMEPVAVLYVFAAAAMKAAARLPAPEGEEAVPVLHLLNFALGLALAAGFNQGTQSPEAPKEPTIP